MALVPDDLPDDVEFWIRFDESVASAVRVDNGEALGTMSIPEEIAGLLKSRLCCVRCGQDAMACAKSLCDGRRDPDEPWRYKGEVMTPDEVRAPSDGG